MSFPLNITNLSRRRFISASAGLVAGTEAPSSLARVVTFYTQSSNRRRHGRLMLSGCESAQFFVSDGAVNATELALMQSLGDALVTSMEIAGDEFQLCIPATDTLPQEDITSCLARTTPGSIRSRRIKSMYIG